MDQLEGLQGLTEIGRGGFGVVYKATETDLNRTVAVKVLNEASADLARKRLDRERRAMGVLSGHPNIVTIYRTGTTGNSPYLVMEFLGGGSLADRLQQGPAIPWQEAVNIGTALADAIEASHQAGVLHRDIKPANVLLSDTGVAKLGDFGIANVDAVSQTSGVMKATVAHAPPEVLSGREGDGRSDIYSLASTIYELITGRPAFVRPEDTSPVPVMMRITSEPVPDIDPAICPPAVTRCLQQAMAKEPDHRPSTAADFRQFLIAAAQDPSAPNPSAQNPSIAPAAQLSGQQTVHAFAPPPLGPTGNPPTGPGGGVAPPPAQNPAAYPGTTGPSSPPNTGTPAAPAAYTGVPSPPAGYQNTPGQNPPLQNTPLQNTPGQSPPGQQAPLQNAPSQAIPGQHAPGQHAPAQHSPAPHSPAPHSPAPHSPPPGPQQAYQPAPFQTSGPPPAFNTGNPGLQQAPQQGSNSSLPLIIGGIFAAFLLIAGGTYFATRGGDDDPDVQTITDPTTGDSTDPTETTGSTSTTTPTTQSTTTQPPTTLATIDVSTVGARTAALRLIAAGQLKITPGYDTLPAYSGLLDPFSDGAGVISVQVPTEWVGRNDATENGVPGIQVADDLPGTQTGAAASGIVVFVYARTLLESAFGSSEPGVLLDEIIKLNEIDCAESTDTSFAHAQFAGDYRILTDCAGSDPDLMGMYMVGTLTQNPDYVLQVTLLTSEPEAIGAAQEALDSVIINLGNL